MTSFHARHQYARPDWSVEENRRHFGEAVMQEHGHLYRLEATVEGALGEQSGAVIDLALLDRILTEEIRGPLGGNHLHAVIPAFRAGAQQSTCEALAAWCWGRIAARLPSEVTLARVRVSEDETLWAECSGAA